MSELTAQIEERDDTSIICLSGYLSSENAGALEDAFGQAAAAGKILLVFRENDFITSAGLAVLFDLILSAQEQGKKIRIAQPAAHFRKVFDIVGLSRDVEVFDALEPALAQWD